MIEIRRIIPFIVLSDVRLGSDLDVGDVGILIQHMDIKKWGNPIQGLLIAVLTTSILRHLESLTENQREVFKLQ